MSTALPRSARLVQTWTRLYTSGLPAEVAERRRMELASDLWEHLNDPSEGHGFVAIVGRWLRGVPADVWWRYRALADARRSRPADAPAARGGGGWWVVLVALVGLARIVTSVGSATFADQEIAPRLIGTVSGVVTGAMVLAGLRLRARSIVNGSWLIVIGSVAMLDPIGLPLAALVVITGLWTANLQFSDRPDELRIVIAQRQRTAMTRRWYLWLAAAAVLFGIGLLFPVFVYDDGGTASAEHAGGLETVAGVAAWMTWWWTWLSAAVCAGVGLILGILHGVVRLRSAKSDVGGGER